MDSCSKWWLCWAVSRALFFCLTFLKPGHPIFVGMAPEGTVTTDGRESPGGRFQLRGKNGQGSAGLECTTSSGSECTAPGVIQDRNESLTWVLGERMNQAVSEVPFELKKKKKKSMHPEEKAFVAGKKEEDSKWPGRWFSGEESRLSGEAVEQLS